MLLRTRLLLFACLCAAIPICLSTFWSARIASDSIESESRQRGREVFDQANTFMQNKVDSLFSYAFLAMSNPGLPLSLEKKNWNLLYHVTDSIQKGLQLDILEVIDGNGILAYSIENPQERGTDRVSNEFLRRLFRADESGRQVAIVGVERRPRGVALEVASLLPKISAPLSGAILMGFYLNDPFFQNMKKIMNADFCLLSEGGVVAQTFQDAAPDGQSPLAKLLGDAPSKDPASDPAVSKKIALGGRPYFLTLKRLSLTSEDLRLGVFIPMENAERARRRSILYIALAGTIGIVVAFGLAIALSRSIMTPIEHLTQAVDSIGKGNFDTRVPVDSRDEIGFLAYTFNAMLAQLRQAQEKIIRTEKLAAIGQLASGVGHELRNPLAAIKNAIYFVKGVIKKTPQKDLEPALQMLDIAESEIHATVKISNDLLEFSRAIRVSPAKVEIHTVLNSALSVIRVPEKVELKKKWAEKLPFAYVDQERMRQVFINLINNGVEAMPNGGVLEIETCYNGKAVEIFVRDTGSGIKDEDRDKIFDPLFSTKAKGTGLGLAIVKGIVDSHHGQISFKSVVGQGTEFRVEVPADPESAARAEGKTQSA